MNTSSHYRRVGLFLGGTFIVVASLAIVFSTFVKGCLGARRWDIVVPSSEWPEAVRLLADQAAEQGIDLGNCTLIQMATFDYLLCADGDDELLTWLANRVDLAEVESNHAIVQYVVKRLPERCEPFLDTDATRYYASETWLAGDEDDCYLVMHHRNSGVLGMWYYKNF